MDINLNLTWESSKWQLTYSNFLMFFLQSIE